MKRRFLLFAVAAVSLLLLTAGSPQSKSPLGEKKTVTGCLQNGDEVNKFSITGEDGKMYGLRNSTVDLSQHVGHKVTISGTLKPEKKEGESQEYSPKRSAEVGDIRVSSIKMIGQNCNK